MPSCGHLDWPCCGCGDDLEHFNNGDLCPDCGEPESFCCCDEMNDEDCDGDDMDGDHESGLWGLDEDYGYYGDLDCDD